jgi:hypothetical protein
MADETLIERVQVLDLNKHHALFLKVDRRLDPYETERIMAKFKPLTDRGVTCYILEPGMDVVAARVTASPSD